MKKLLVSILTVIAAVALGICVSACDKTPEQDPIVGTFKIQEMGSQVGDNFYTWEAGSADNVTPMTADSVVYTFNADGTFTYKTTMMGFVAEGQASYEDSGKWESKGDGRYTVNVSQLSGAPKSDIEVVVKDGKMTIGEKSDDSPYYQIYNKV